MTRVAESVRALAGLSLILVAAVLAPGPLDAQPAAAPAGGDDATELAKKGAEPGG